MRTRALAISSFAIAMIVVACSVQGSSEFQEIAVVPSGLTQTTAPTTTAPPTTAPPTTAASTTTTEPATTQTMAETTSTIPTERINLYFVAGSRLTPIQRELAAPTPETVLFALQDGQLDDDTAVGLRTVLPKRDDFELTVTVDRGIAEVTVPNDSFAAAGDDARLAFGQIVLSLLPVQGTGGLRGIGGVRFVVGPEQPIAVIRGDTSVAEPGLILTVEDYAELLA